MLKFSIFLFFSIFLLTTVTAESDQTCENRCTRLKHRSLSRIGYDDERLVTLFERQRPRESMRDVCWRLYDNLDCMKKCSKSEKHAVFAKFVRNKCKFVLEDMEPTLKCISKHHSFLQMRCSSFLNEASRLRAESDLSTTPRHETCRYLHLTTICLENHVNTFCPNGRNVFRRLNFRDYFLSFILPMDDDLFDDEDLDSCQIYDFVKDAEKREREDAERKQEEERRRRIEDDEDYEEELTTIVNDMEDESPSITTPSEYQKTSTSSSTSSTTTTKKTTTPLTLSSQKTKEFTSLLDDLIDSAESETGVEGSTTTSQGSLENGHPLNHEGDLSSREGLAEEGTTSKVDPQRDQDHQKGTPDHQDPLDPQDLSSQEEPMDHQEGTDSHLEPLDPQDPSIHEDPLDPSTHENPSNHEDPLDHQDHHDYPDNHNNHYDDDDYHYPDGHKNTTHPTISVVSIETRLSDERRRHQEEEEEEEPLVEVTPPDEPLHVTPPNLDSDEVRIIETTTTSKRKVFSEDSMENTPPNFHYSSNRYDSTTLRSNYVADNLDLQDSEEPLEIDTSTLFGIEVDSSSATSSTVTPTVVISSPSTTKRVRPWLHGGVIVKPILNFDEIDVDLDEARERENRRLAHLANGTSSATSSEDVNDDDDDFIADSETPSTNETLIVIGLIALVICLIFLILLLLLAYFCSARTDSYNVQKDEGSPPV